MEKSYWLIVGSVDNWEEAFQKGNIWGFREKQRYRWNALQEGDIVLFYIMRPVAGIIGYGTIKTKFRQTQPLWTEEVEKSAVIWPLRFEFGVENCLPPDKWESDKYTSEVLRFKAGLGFRQLDVSIAQDIISQLTKRHITESEEPILHKEMKEKLIEIGKLQNYIAEGEYPFDLGRLAVVWRRVERSVPTYVFEVNVKGDLYHALSKLKHAFDLWNSRIFVVASQGDRDKVKSLLSGTFHEIRGELKFIESEKVGELYKRKRSFFDLEKELGM